MVLQMDGLVQACGMSSVLAMEMLEFCTKPRSWYLQRISNGDTAVLY